MKAFRQGQILKLIRAKSIHTQEELAHALAGVGVEATQVTLSRDMRELGLVKTPEGYKELEANSEKIAPDLATLVSEFLQDVRLAQNLLVVKTTPGGANSMAVALDQADWPQIVGTVAGDDTILIVTPDNKSAIELRQKIIELA